MRGDRRPAGPGRGHRRAPRAALLLGFAREVVLAAAYGTSGATDAFVNSLLIVNTVAAVLLYTLVTLIIPVFQRERYDHGADSAWRSSAPWPSGPGSPSSSWPR